MNDERIIRFAHEKSLRAIFSLTRAGADRSIARRIETFKER